jgi:hypothetical protein
MKRSPLRKSAGSVKVGNGCEPGNDWENLNDEEGSIGQSATPEEVVVRAKAGTAVVHSRNLNVAVSLCAALRGRRVQQAALGAEERAKLLST